MSYLQQLLIGKEKQSKLTTKKKIGQNTDRAIADKQDLKKDGTIAIADIELMAGHEIRVKKSKAISKILQKKKKSMECRNYHNDPTHRTNQRRFQQECPYTHHHPNQ